MKHENIKQKKGIQAINSQELKNQVIPEPESGEMILIDLVEKVKEGIQMLDYSDCRSLICKSMLNFPDSPVPHNLMGILLETKQDHIQAMKHFRAAYALDPTYIPARYNMDQYGSFQTRIKCAFCEADVEIRRDDKFEIQYNERGIGRLVRKNEAENALEWRLNALVSDGRTLMFS